MSINIPTTLNSIITNLPPAATAGLVGYKALRFGSVCSLGLKFCRFFPPEDMLRERREWDLFEKTALSLSSIAALHFSVLFMEKEVLRLFHNGQDPGQINLQQIAFLNIQPTATALGVGVISAYNLNKRDITVFEITVFRVSAVALVYFLTVFAGSLYRGLRPVRFIHYFIPQKVRATVVGVTAIGCLLLSISNS